MKGRKKTSRCPRVSLVFCSPRANNRWSFLARDCARVMPLIYLPIHSKQRLSPSLALTQTHRHLETQGPKTRWRKLITGWVCVCVWGCKAASASPAPSYDPPAKVIRSISRLVWDSRLHHQVMREVMGR